MLSTYSKYTFRILNSPVSELPSLFVTYWIQSLSSEDVFSHLGG